LIGMTLNRRNRKASMAERGVAAMKITSARCACRCGPLNYFCNA